MVMVMFHNTSRIFDPHLYLGVLSLASHLDNIGPMTAHTRTRPANQRPPTELHVISAPLCNLHRVLFVCLRTGDEISGSVAGSLQTEEITHDFPLMRTPATAEDARSRTEREHRRGSGVRCCWMRV